MHRPQCGQRDADFGLTCVSCGLFVSSDPILAYNAGSEVNQLVWGASQPDWVTIVFDNKLQILRV